MSLVLITREDVVHSQREDMTSHEHQSTESGSPALMVPRWALAARAGPGGPSRLCERRGLPWAPEGGPCQ